MYDFSKIIYLFKCIFYLRILTYFIILSVGVQLARCA